MNWQDWLRSVGIAVPDVPNVEEIVLALVLVAGAYWIGWFAGSRAGPPAVRTINRWVGHDGGLTSRLAAAVIRHGTAVLLLLVVGNAATLSPIALMIVAVALGIAVALLVFHIGKAAGLGAVTAGVIAAVALVASTAGTLGGMRPLILALDKAGFSAGRYRFSLLGVINAIVVAAVLFVTARIINRIIVHSIGRMNALDVSQRALLQKLSGMVVIVAAVLIGIDVLGIDLTALTVFSGAFGLAVGFGLQKTFGNLISGLILLMDRSVKPGDVIVVGDTFGQVSKIGIRAVSVITRDGKEHLIPNEELMTTAVENWSYTSRNVRIHIPVGVAYGCDLAVAQRLMVEAATAAGRVLAEPKPSVWLKGFGDSSVDHDILIWIADPELGVGNVQSEILNRVWTLFAANGIEIPFPQRDIYIRGLPPVEIARGGPAEPMVSSRPASTD